MPPLQQPDRQRSAKGRLDCQLLMHQNHPSSSCALLQGAEDLKITF